MNSRQVCDQRNCPSRRHARSQVPRGRWPRETQSVAYDLLFASLLEVFDETAECKGLALETLSRTRGWVNSEREALQGEQGT